MTLSDKERYVFHMAITMALAISTNKKFDLKQVEKELKQRGKNVIDSNLEELNEIWNPAASAAPPETPARVAPLTLN